METDVPLTSMERSMEISRRDAIKGAGAALAATAIPAPITMAAVAEATRAPAWAVGAPGEWNWTVIRAFTADEAKHEWLESYGIDKPEKCGTDDCGCEEGWPCDYSSFMDSDYLDAERREDWDDKDVEAGDTTWFASGLGAYCGRCHFETCTEDGGHVVGDEIVCADCMQIDDWKIVDPEEYAERLLAESD